MPDTYVQLPNGQYVQIPDGASPDQLMQMKIKLAGMQQPKAPSFLDAANQSKQQMMANSPLAPTERAMQQGIGGAPMFVDVPKGQKQAFESAGQKGYTSGGKAGAASLAIPSAIAAPVATALGIGGSIAGGYAGKKGAEFLGASPSTAETAGDVGGVIGGVVGAGLPSGAAAMREFIKKAAVNPSGELTPGFNALVHPSEMGEMLFRKLIGAPKETEGAAVPITESPYYKQWIEAKKTQALAAKQADAATKAAQAAENAARKAVSIKESPYYNQNLEKQAAADAATKAAQAAENAAREAVSIKESPYYNQNLEKQAAADAAPKFEAEPSNPQGKIVSPASTPPPVQRTYKSIPGDDLLQMVKKGDRAAIVEWQRRGLKLPGGVGFMVEQGAPSTPYNR